jgi:hypothetical protein
MATMETAMAKIVISGATAALMAISALQAPGALAKDGRGDGRLHAVKGSNYRNFHIRHDGNGRSFDDWKGYKHRNFHFGGDRDNRGSYFWKGYNNRHVHIRDDDDRRGSYYWKWKKKADPSRWER